MRKRLCRWARAAAVAAAVSVALAACSTVVDGKATTENALDANLAVVGSDPSSTFDKTVKNSLSDIEAFWKINYPKVSGGKALAPLKGGLFSVDGLGVAQKHAVTGPAAQEGCISKDPSFIIDNGAFCLLDDSIAWDRAQTHLFAQLAKQYGEFVVALVFAHEFGHAISYRLGIFDQHPRTILTESQADCAAGAWAASALAHQDPHFRDVTPQKLDNALEGYLDGRDSTPDSPASLSHGNGFDRLSALADGIKHGVTYCYAAKYFDRQFTERPYTNDSSLDKQQNGNEPLAQVIDASPPTANGTGGGGLQPDLNRFWGAAAKSIGKTFTGVKIAQADHPKCGPSTSEFGYCPDNTVYFSASFAKAAYNSLPDLQVDRSTGNITLLFDQPADFTLGTLFAVGWGMAVRHQLFTRSLDDKAALLAAVCYTGAYAKDVNVAASSTARFLLSPPDMDEATSAMLKLVGDPKAYGDRGTTGLERIQSFVKGYNGGLPVC